MLEDGRVPTMRIESLRGCGEDRSSELGDLSIDVVSKSPSLLMFSVVGTAGSTRKRSNGSRRGRWWSASGWAPGPRTCTPWKARRRILPMSVMSDEPLVEGGRKGYYYQTLEESLVVCLDRSMEDEIVDRRIEQNNLLFARNIATSDKRTTGPKIRMFQVLV